jgi:hypothetical protein
LHADSDSSTMSKQHNDDEDDNDESSQNDSSKHPMTTAEGQMIRNPQYSYMMASLAAKREYNRRNAARARRRAKAQLHTYQQQIQVLNIQIAQSKEQNSTLLATLRSLQEENTRILQNQQTIDNLSGNVNHWSTNTFHETIPSIIDRNIHVISSATLQQPLNQILLQLYLTGAAIQQSVMSSQQQQQQQAPITSTILHETQPTVPNSWPLAQRHQQQTTLFPYTQHQLQQPDTDVSRQYLTWLISQTVTPTTSTSNIHTNSDHTNEYG